MSASSLCWCLHIVWICFCWNIPDMHVNSRQWWTQSSDEWRQKWSPFYLLILLNKTWNLAAIKDKKKAVSLCIVWKKRGRRGDRDWQAKHCGWSQEPQGTRGKKTHFKSIFGEVWKSRGETLNSIVTRDRSLCGWPRNQKCQKKFCI